MINNNDYIRFEYNLDTKIMSCFFYSISIHNFISLKKKIHYFLNITFKDYEYYSYYQSYFYSNINFKFDLTISELIERMKNVFGANIIIEEKCNDIENIKGIILSNDEIDYSILTVKIKRNNQNLLNIKNILFEFKNNFINMEHRGD